MEFVKSRRLRDLVILITVFLCVFAFRAIKCEVLISDPDVVMLGFEEASWSSLRLGFSVNLGIRFVQG